MIFKLRNYRQKHRYFYDGLIYFTQQLFLLEYSV